MKLLYTFLLLSLLAVQARAQDVDFDKVVLPPTETAKTFEDYLVQQAFQNYASTRILNGELAITDLEIKRARTAWLDNINGNLNFSSAQDTIYGRFGQGTRPTQGGPGDDPRFLRPGFNYGVAVNIGGLINNKKDVRIAEAKRVIAVAKLDERKLELRALALYRLETYDNSREILRIRRQANVDAETNNRLVQSLFERGKAQFEDVAQASEVYHRAVEATAMAESNVRLARFGLEELVGKPWTELEPVRERMSVTSPSRRR